MEEKKFNNIQDILQYSWPYFKVMAFQMES
jgi:hypothetical protein